MDLSLFLLNLKKNQTFFRFLLKNQQLLRNLSWVRFTGRSNSIFFAMFNVYGHTMLNTPVLVRSLKLSNIGLS